MAHAGILAAMLMQTVEGKQRNAPIKLTSVSTMPVPGMMAVLAPGTTAFKILILGS